MATLHKSPATKRAPGKVSGSAAGASHEVQLIRKTGKEIAGDPARARQWLIEGGFITKAGQLAPAYRSK